MIIASVDDPSAETLLIMDNPLCRANRSSKSTLAGFHVNQKFFGTAVSRVIVRCATSL